jgi:hypothetical protein
LFSQSRDDFKVGLTGHSVEECDTVEGLILSQMASKVTSASFFPEQVATAGLQTSILF